MKKKILFIGHSAGLTGAPRSLLGIISWLGKNSSYELHLILREGGPLCKEYRKFSSLYFFLPEKFHKTKSLIINIYRRFSLRVYRYFLLKKLKKENFSLIYSNTIVNRNVLEFLHPIGCKVITHVRELEDTINIFGGRSLVDYMNRRSEWFITISEACRKTLTAKFGIDSKKIIVINNFFLPPKQESISNRDVVLSELGIPTGSFIIGSAGGLLWRKGPDLFILLAKEILFRCPGKKIFFIWMGEGKDEMLKQLKMDLRLAGLEDKVLFIGNRENPYSYFRVFDVLAMMSREEPFGLVGLEAAYFGTPTLCFENAGGMPEFVGKDCGFAVPYLQIAAMAEKACLFINDEDLRRQFGENAKKRAFQDFNIDSQMKLIYAEIEKAII